MNEQPRPPRVDPGLIFGISLLTALVISWPGFSGAMNGSADIVSVGARFLIAVAVIWSGLFIVTSVIAGFAAAPALPTARPDQETDSASPPTTAAALGALAPNASDPARPAALEAEAAAAIAAETEHVAG